MGTTTHARCAKEWILDPTTWRVIACECPIGAGIVDLAQATGSVCSHAWTMIDRSRSLISLQRHLDRWMELLAQAALTSRDAGAT